MPVLERDALESSPLADLHAIASELAIDGYRRLRKPELIDALLERGATQEEQAPAETAEPEAPTTEEERPRRRGRRGGRGRGAAREEPAGTDQSAENGTAEEPEGAPADTAAPPAAPPPDAELEADGGIVEGIVELVAGGAGFLRVSPGEVSDGDVYISAAQVKRCELVNGDRVSGPRRAARRSERFASLIRIETINGAPATEVVEGARYEDLPAAFPSVRLPLSSDDPTVKAIDALLPIGRGSRVTITGATRAGKSRVLRALTDALADCGVESDAQVLVALAGVRPEEITEWRTAPIAPAAALSFAASPDAQDQAVELVIDQAKRIAARGGNAIVLIDTLDGLHPHTARKILAAARQIVDGGSLTLIATASKPLGGETTVVALDAAKASVAQPALDLAASGTLRVELLVGERGAATIARNRAKALK
jgi:transcription termination factor Rho